MVKPRYDTGWWQPEKQSAQPRTLRKDIQRRSHYLTMRDGVRIAIDVYLPRDLGAGDKLPTILHQTRYFRRATLNWPFRWLFPSVSPTVLRFVGNGYAWVSVDARGSGASFGSRAMEWSPDERQDGVQVVDWIVEQPWSDGKVGTTGISYDSTAAEMLLAAGHPAIKAAVIRYSLFDVYADVLCPGGVYHERFMRVWSAGNDAMDRNDLAPFTRQQAGALAALIVRGVAPVDDDADEGTLKKAVATHVDNYDVYQTALQLPFRDDVTTSGVSLDQFSPHAHRQETQATGAAIYSMSSWFDGAYQRAAIVRHLNVDVPGKRLLLGPWDHGGSQNPDPFVPDHKARFDHNGEMLRFFDHHLKGIPTGIEDEAPVHYFTMGEGAWKSAETWPPPGFTPTPFHLGQGRSLHLGDPPQRAGADTYQADYTTSSGTGTRWVALVNVGRAKIRYPDRKQADERLLTYTSPPLERDLEVTGHPVVTLYLRSSTPDAQLFAYLEDVTPDGDVHYVTEGLFHAIHRKVSQEPPPYELPAGIPYHTFRREDAMPLIPGEAVELAFDLLPVSYLFKKGHAIRLAIAGADADNFALLPPSPPQIEVLWGRDHPSHISLPIVERG